MRRFSPLRPDRQALLARANPVAKLGAAAILMALLLVSSSPVTPAIVLTGVLAAVPLTGLRARDLLARTWPLPLAALSVGILNVLLAPGAKDAADVMRGASLGMRLLGVALSGVLAIASTDPTELADALQQQARLPRRLSVSVMAAVRMLPLFAAEWQILRMARRARGVSVGWSPINAARLVFGELLTLLVGSVRRATRLAMAMDARGFGAAACHTVARPQRMRTADWGLLAAAIALGAVGVGIGVAV